MFLLYAMLQSPIIPPRLPVEEAAPIVLMPAPEEPQSGLVPPDLLARIYDDVQRLASRLLGCTGSAGAEERWSPRYVPPTGWENCKSAAFLEERLGRQLGAMNEPPLSRPADLADYRTRFRMLVLPSFEPAFAYRVDEHRDGRAVLRWVRLDGRGGYAPGRIAEQSSRELSSAQWARLKRAISSARLDELPREKRSGWTRTASGEQVLTSCFDGTGYVYELLDRSGAHLVTRRCGIEEGPLRSLAEITLSLNGMTLEGD